MPYSEQDVLCIQTKQIVASQHLLCIFFLLEIYFIASENESLNHWLSAQNTQQSSPNAH